MLLARSVHPSLGRVAGAAANGRPFERVADDSKQPWRADRLSPRLTPCHADPATPAPPRVRDLATPIGQKHAPAIEQTDDSFHIGTMIAAHFRFGDEAHVRHDALLAHG
jgi:hypothetical protein